MRQSNNPTVLNDLALCLARQGKLPQAERALQRAVQLAPQKPLYRNNIAKIQVELNNLDAAVTHLAAVYPRPVVSYNMGVLLYQRGRTADAERFLAGAVAADPRMEPPAHCLLRYRHRVPSIAPRRRRGRECRRRIRWGRRRARRFGPAARALSAPPSSESEPALLPPVL